MGWLMVPHCSMDFQQNRRVSGFQRGIAEIVLRSNIVNSVEIRAVIG